MTDAQAAVPSDRPEYTPEQIEESKAYFERIEWMGLGGSMTKHIRTILSALSRAECDTARLDGIFAWGGIDDGQGGHIRSRGDVDTILLASPIWSPLREAIDAARNPSTESTNG
jgi:hypothetical protein